MIELIELFCLYTMQLMMTWVSLLTVPMMAIAIYMAVISNKKKTYFQMHEHKENCNNVVIILLGLLGLTIIFGGSYGALVTVYELTAYLVGIIIVKLTEYGLGKRMVVEIEKVNDIKLHPSMGAGYLGKVPVSHEEEEYLTKTVPLCKDEETAELEGEEYRAETVGKEDTPEDKAEEVEPEDKAEEVEPEDKAEEVEPEDKAETVNEENKPEIMAEETGKEVEPEDKAETVNEENKPEIMAEETGKEVEPEDTADIAGEEDMPEDRAEEVKTENIGEEVKPENKPESIGEEDMPEDGAEEIAEEDKPIEEAKEPEHINIIEN